MSLAAACPEPVTRTFHAPRPVRRPYSPLFMALRQACSTLIEQMERKGAVALPPLDRPFQAEEWEAYHPGLILATVDWDAPRLVFNWAVDDDRPVRAARSPDYTIDLAALKSAARADPDPRGWFESQAAYALSLAQDYLIDFFRDGPTDDIPFERHLIFVRGLEGLDGTLWIKNVLFAFEETPG